MTGSLGRRSESLRSVVANKMKLVIVHCSHECRLRSLGLECIVGRKLTRRVNSMYYAGDQEEARTNSASHQEMALVEIRESGKDVCPLGLTS